jgi:hypothetical protein
MGRKLLRRGSGRKWTAFVLTIAAAISPLGFVTSSGADGTWANVQPASFSSGVQNSAANAQFTAVSCSGLTCVAAGNFTNTSGYEQAVTDTSDNGGVSWALVQQPTFGAGVLSSTTPESNLASVSCSGSTCVAAGEFANTSGYEQAFTQTSVNDGVTWSDAQPANYAPGLQVVESQFVAVSCSGSTCAAVGNYGNNQAYQGLIETSENGGLTWGDAQAVDLTNVVQNPSSTLSVFTSVSCSGLTCVTAGDMVNPNSTYEAITETTSDGGVTWDVAQPIVFAGGVATDSQESSVSCSGLTCVAAGTYVGTGIVVFAMTDTSSDGGLTWAIAQPATFAAGVQNTDTQTVFNSISCSGSTCVAAGQYFSAGFAEVAVTETSTDGGLTWATPQAVSLADGLQNATAPYADFNAVSCSGSTCVAAGEFLDASGSIEAMTQTSSDGGASWSTARPATFAAGVQSPTTPTAYFYAVSCTSLTCVTAGVFLDPQPAYEAMTDTNLLAPSISPITNLYVTQNGPVLSATWNASAGATSYTCTLMFGFNTPSTFTMTASTPACSFTGLSSTTPYGVAVVANGPDGSSSSVSAFGAPTPTTTTTIHKIPRPVERTIVCVRAKKVKRVRGVHPTCPSGYKKK